MVDKTKDTPEAEEDLTPSLVIQLRQEDTKAGDLLSCLYRESITRFCRGYLGNQQEAEDVVQDVFCKVLSSTTIPDNFRAWLYRIARNRCLDLIRSRQRRRDDVTLRTEPQIDLDPTGHLTRLVKAEQRERLWDVLSSLPENQREVLRLRYTENLSRAEIAEILEISESLVKSRLFEGLEKLRRHPSLNRFPA